MRYGSSLGIGIRLAPMKTFEGSFEGKTAARALIETVERALQLGNEPETDADTSDDDDFEIDAAW